MFDYTPPKRLQRIRRAVKGNVLQPRYAVQDWRENRRWGCNRRDTKFLILRHAGKSPYAHDYFLNWLATKAPHLRGDFELRLLPHVRVDPAPYAVFAAWLQDPAEDWMDVRSYRQTIHLENIFRASGRAVINPIQRLTVGVKSHSSRLFERCGVRTPKVVPILNPTTFDPALEGLQFPILIREDRRHAAPMLHLWTADDLKLVPWQRFKKPIAAEYIDVRDPNDGLYRKYRFVAADGIGVPRHLIVSKSWEVRAEVRISNNRTQQEEIAYGNQAEPNAEVLQELRRAMGLNLVAFDYSYDQAGQLVVWEANAFANLSFPAGENLEYTRPFVERSYAAIAAMYYRAAGMPIDPLLRQMLGDCYQPARGDFDMAYELAS